MSLKPALSLKDQISLLQKRGVAIKDIYRAEDFLAKNNYYRLNVYFHKFMDKENHFKDGTFFDQIIGIYENDSWLRNKILSILEPLEIKIKTYTAYHLGLTYGADCFYNKDIFINEWNNFLNLHKIFEREISYRNNDPVVIHHKSKYHGIYPIWVIVEFLSFNAISKLYSNLRRHDRKIIAEHVCITSEVYLENWLHCMSVLRNICAHYGYLFRRNYSIKPKLFKEWNLQNNNNLFTLFLMIKTLTDNKKWDFFINSIIEQEKLSEYFSLNDYGFSENLKSMLFI